MIQMIPCSPTHFQTSIETPSRPITLPLSILLRASLTSQPECYYKTLFILLELQSFHVTSQSLSLIEKLIKTILFFDILIYNQNFLFFILNTSYLYKYLERASLMAFFVPFLHFWQPCISYGLYSCSKIGKLFKRVASCLTHSFHCLISSILIQCPNSQHYCIHIRS